MDDFGRKFKTFDWKNLQRQAKKVQASTASALKDMVMTDLENKVRAATGDTSWGAGSADLALIAAGTYNREDFTLIMSIVWQRLGSSRWRCVYKALDVLKYLVLHGAARVLDDARDAMPHIRRLEHFAFVDPVTRRDEGANVRARAAAFVVMLNDDAVLDEERAKSEELRAKIGAAAPPGGSGPGALSSDDYRYGGRHDDDGASMPPGRGRRGPYSPTGAYDDDPAGGFADAARRSAQSNGGFDGSVDDLLGGAVDDAPAAAAPQPGLGLGELGMAAAPGATAPVSNGAAFSLGEDDDDEFFDPRNGGSAQVPANGGLNGVLNGANGPAVNGDLMNGAATTNGAAVPTSQLVANLAAARSAAADEAARTETAATPANAQRDEAAKMAAKGSENAAPDVAYGGLVHFENLMLDKSTRVDSHAVKDPAAATSPTPKPAAVPAPVPAPVAKVEADPFGDLLSTAKKTGVL